MPVLLEEALASLLTIAAILVLGGTAAWVLAQFDLPGDER